MANYRATVFGHLTAGEEWAFTWHFQAVTGQVATMAGDAADAVTLLWNGAAPPADSITQMVNPAVGVDGVTVDELSPATGVNVAQFTESLALVGTSTAESLPPHVTVAVSTRTATPTRSGRGRFFLPPFSADQLDGGKLLAADRGRVAAAAVGALNHMKGLSWLPIVYHARTVNGTLINAIDVGDVFDQQSRRRNQLVETRTRIALT